ncbi:MAG: type II toxin-antitoxin system HicB family antitoxin [Microcystaceae cyanobacterium]
MADLDKRERLPLDYYLGLKYPISIYPEEEGGYTTMIPDLPDCMTQGETLENVAKNIEEARQLWTETVYLSQKREIPRLSTTVKNKNDILW